MSIFLNPFPKWLKQGVSIFGLLMAIAGLAIGLIVLLLVLIMFLGDDPAVITVGLIGGTVTLVVVGTGVATFWHSLASLEGKVSGLFRVGAFWKLMVMFGVCLVLGQFIFLGNIAPGLLLPPIFVVAGLLPPLAVLSLWGMREIEALTWRRCVCVFFGGATMATAAILGTQIGWLIITELFLNSVAVSNLITAIENESAISLFVQLGLVIPMAGLLVAPLVTLPWLKRISQRDAFLLGAVAGTGFAGVLTVIYISFDVQMWFWVLVIQAVGCAVLPLSTGLVTLGWQRVVRGQGESFTQWLALFGSASAALVLWNIGLTIILGNVGLEPGIPMGNLGAVSIGLAGVTLVVIGTICLWAGKWLVNVFSTSSQGGGTALSSLTFASNNQAISVWALACVIALVPAGLIVVRFL